LLSLINQRKQSHTKDSISHVYQFIKANFHDSDEEAELVSKGAKLASKLLNSHSQPLEFICEFVEHLVRACDKSIVDVLSGPQSWIPVLEGRIAVIEADRDEQAIRSQLLVSLSLIGNVFELYSTPKEYYKTQFKRLCDSIAK